MMFERNLLLTTSTSALKYNYLLKPTSYHSHRKIAVKQYKRKEALWIDYKDPNQKEDGTPFRFTGKERDLETGLYYYGARYLDPKTSRWMSTDPAMYQGDYIPGAPVNDEARKRNGNLPGQGGVFNFVNMHVYHYAGNNPVKYVDPTGRDDVHFLYVYKAYDPKDQKMKNKELESINKVVQYLRDQGLTVKINEEASQLDVNGAFADSEALLIIISGHGMKKALIETSEGLSFSPSDITNIGENLNTVIFQNCYQGNYKKEWKNKIGEGREIVSWKWKTDYLETIRFNTSGLFDRQKMNLMDYAKKAVKAKQDIISKLKK